MANAITIHPTAHAVQNPDTRRKQKSGNLATKLLKTAILSLPFFLTGHAQAATWEYRTANNVYTTDNLAQGGEAYKDNNRISAVQNGNQLTITYKSYGFNHNYSWNGTDSEHRVAAHCWGLFDAQAKNHTAIWGTIEMIDYYDDTAMGGIYDMTDCIFSDITPATWVANATPEDKTNLASQTIANIQTLLENLPVNGPKDPYPAVELKDALTSTLEVYTRIEQTNNYQTSKAILTPLVYQKTAELNTTSNHRIWIGGTIYENQTHFYTQPYRKTKSTDEVYIGFTLQTLTNSHRCLWAANNGNFGGTGGASVAETFTQTITLTPDLVGKTYRLISWQKSHHTGSSDYDKWGYFYGDNITIQPFSLATPTSQDYEIKGIQPWHPAITTSETRPHEKQYQVQGYTDWLPETQTWTPPIIGTYTFQVRLSSKDPNWDDSNPSGTYKLKVNQPSIPLNIQTPIEVTIALGDTYVPELPDETNDYKDVGTYELKVPNQNLEINVPIGQLAWKPSPSGTYTLTLQHKGEIIGNTEYLKSELVTITLHVLQDHPPLVEGKRSTSTANSAIPDGHYTYAGDTLNLEITTTDPDHDHDPNLQQQLEIVYYKLIGPKGDILEDPDVYPDTPDANGRNTKIITTKLSDGPGTYRMFARAQDYAGLSSPETEIYRITVTEPYAFYRVTASAKPAAGLEAWFTPSGTTQQIVKLPRPRGPIQTQPNP